MKLISPAKINVFLRVFGRRSDGYHDLASLFQAIDLCDLLDIQLSNDGVDRLSCDQPSVPNDASNLIIKAANLFRRKTKLAFGLTVHLEKRIPIQAGLGGGSSNAATTLWGLNQLCGCPATIDELIAWSGEIGSDITFFLSQGTAYCTGRGEIMRLIPPLPRQDLWIAKPTEGLSTPDVFKRFDNNKADHRDPELALSKCQLGEFACFNDLELPAFLVLPKLAEIKNELQKTCSSQTLMSGSGTSFFCLGVQKPWPIFGVDLFPARFINRASETWYC